jgi:hypothetical protein
MHAVELYYLDLERACKLGNQKFTAGELKGEFKSRREMTDLIKEVIDDHVGTECPSCASAMNE